MKLNMHIEKNRASMGKSKEQPIQLIDHPFFEFVKKILIISKKFSQNQM